MYKKALKLLDAADELVANPHVTQKSLKIAAIEVFTCSIPSILYQDPFFKDYEMSFFELSPGGGESRLPSPMELLTLESHIFQARIKM